MIELEKFLRDFLYLFVWKQKHKASTLRYNKPPILVPETSI